MVVPHATAHGLTTRYSPVPGYVPDSSNRCFACEYHIIGNSALSETVMGACARRIGRTCFFFPNRVHLLRRVLLIMALSRTTIISETLDHCLCSIISFVMQHSRGKRREGDTTVMCWRLQYRQHRHGLQQLGAERGEGRTAWQVAGFVETTEDVYRRRFRRRPHVQAQGEGP